jgi:hypothetical protein
MGIGGLLVGAVGARRRAAAHRRPDRVTRSARL